MEKTNISEDTSKNLDAVRGVMAMLVALHHTRNNFMPQALQPSGGQSALTFIFRFMTGFGGAPVIVFFVLSGFWISKVVVDRFIKNAFDWRVYLMERFLRLHIVLLPILLIQFLLILFFGHLDKGGLWGNLKELLGNVLFLQNYVGEYGGNFQLWSLQYEFWYYVLFPACVTVLFSRNLLARLVCGLIAAFVFWVFPAKLGLYFTLWLVGSVVYGIHFQKDKWQFWNWVKPFSPRLTGIGLILLALLNGRFGAGTEHGLYHSEYWQDLVTALIAGLAFLFLGLENGKKAGKVNEIMDWAVRQLSRTAPFSYSLYIIHVPILLGLNYMFLSFVDRYRIINVKSIAVVMVIWILIIFISYLYSLLTEVHYKKIKEKWASAIRNRLTAPA